MTRALDLSRDEAELLDDLLMEHVKRNPNGFDARIGHLAAQLCETWGMSYWHHRPGSGFTAEEWADLVKFSEFGHREKSPIR